MKYARYKHEQGDGERLRHNKGEMKASRYRGSERESLSEFEQMLTAPRVFACKAAQGLACLDSAATGGALAGGFMVETGPVSCLHNVE
jgi:hypothetical protein